MISLSIFDSKTELLLRGKPTETYDKGYNDWNLPKDMNQSILKWKIWLSIDAFNRKIIYGFGEPRFETQKICVTYGPEDYNLE